MDFSICSSEWMDLWMVCNSYTKENGRHMYLDIYPGLEYRNII